LGIRAVYDFPELYKADLLKAIESIDLGKVDQAIEWFREARDAGRHIFVCGNGGSASTAVAFRLRHRERVQLQPGTPRFAIMALTDQLPTITAYANDVSYDVVFAEQLKNFAERRLSWLSALGEFAERAARE